jgi:tetratricopeptide (TPR) repeat protein
LLSRAAFGNISAGMSTKKSKKATRSSAASSVSEATPAPSNLELKEFVRMFKDSVANEEDTRYCFIIGSGASFTSGVPIGSTLVDLWLTEMFRDDQPGAAEDKRRAWVEQKLRDLPGFTWDKRAESYGAIYKRRFPENARGQSWLRKRMEGKKPSFGYTVLARILAETRHNLVITTNFDNLVHDAVTALPCPHPFIAHSPDDAHYIANHDTKIRIIKLHGDIDRETYNADLLIANLHKNWHEPLRHLLGSYTPIFLGYGGCDPGLMGFLTSEFAYNPASHRPVWTYRVDPDRLKKMTGPVTEPPGRPNTVLCCDFMKAHGGWWMPCPGFDELMVLLGHALEYSHAGKEIRANAERAANIYQTSITNALKAARTHDGSSWCPQLDQMARDAEQALLGEVKLRRWSEWAEYINAAVNPKEELARSHEAIAELPSDPRTYARLAWALTSVNPNDPKASEALANAQRRLNGKYNADSDEALYIRNSHAYLLAHQGKHAEAEAEHRAVLAIRERVLGPEHPDTLKIRNNLANALYAQDKNAEAEAEHRAVLPVMQRVLGPEHPDTLNSRNNLAAVLYSQGKHPEAEKEHRTVLAIMERVLGPEHPDVFRPCFNLSLCLEAQRKKMEALAFARRALDGWRKTLGESHSDTKDAKKQVADLEKSQQASP